MKVLTSRLNDNLSQKFDFIKDNTGYESDAECVRYIINVFFEKEVSKIDPDDLRIANAVDSLSIALPKFIDKKYNGKLPSLREQMKRFRK